MGHEIETELTAHHLREFCGGSDRGVCMQVTTSAPLTVHDDRMQQQQEPGFIQLTMEEAAILCNDLSQFVKREAIRRQGLLREQLERLKFDERTVFQEIAELPADVFGAPKLAVELVSALCPKAAPSPELEAEE